MPFEPDTSNENMVAHVTESNIRNVLLFVGYALFSCIGAYYLWETSKSTILLSRNVFFLIGSCSLSYLNFTQLWTPAEQTHELNTYVHAVGHLSILMYAIFTIVSVVFNHDYFGYTTILPNTIFGMPHIPNYPIDGVMMMVAHLCLLYDVFFSSNNIAVTGVIFELSAVGYNLLFEVKNKGKRLVNIVIVVALLSIALGYTIDVVI
jgi:hypothetical protein